MVERNKDVMILVDRASFPKNCPELQDILGLLHYHSFELNTDSPTVFFNQALKFAEEYELVVPVTRNMFVRDRLRMEGVTTVISL